MMGECPKCGGEMDYGYGMAMGGLGSYEYCCVCPYAQASPDLEGLTEPQAKRVQEAADLGNAGNDLTCDRLRELVLDFDVYEKRHNVKPGALDPFLKASEEQP